MSTVLLLIAELSIITYPEHFLFPYLPDSEILFLKENCVALKFKAFVSF